MQPHQERVVVEKQNLLRSENERLKDSLARFQSKKPELGDLTFREQLRSQIIADALKENAALKEKVDALEKDWNRLNRVFKSTSDKTIDQDIVMEDLSMLIRMMVTKHQRGKLDEEYCKKALDYLQRHNLQGNILRANEVSHDPATD